MKKIVRLTESDLTKLVKRAVNEQLEVMDVSSDSEHYKRGRNKVEIPREDLAMVVSLAKRFCRGKENFPDCQSVDEIHRFFNLEM